MFSNKSILTSESLHTLFDSERYRHPQPNFGWRLGTHGSKWERIAGPKGDRNSTGRPIESVILDPWGLSETEPPIKEDTWNWPRPPCSYVLDVKLGPSGTGAISKAVPVCWIYFTIGMPCPVLVVEETPRLPEIWSEPSTCPEKKGRRNEGRILGGCD